MQINRYWYTERGKCGILWHEMSEPNEKKNVENTWCTFLIQKKLKHEMNFQSHIVKIENFLRLCGVQET